jgi:pyruvate dehydrogenase E2 component (dihydrolipoamide acetyltransferase)
MPIQVSMPKLGLTMEEGTVVEWLKAQGDAVERGEPLFVLETDKLTLEAEAPESGTLGQILVQAGTTVPTGTPVALILFAGEELAVPFEPGQEQSEGQAGGKPKIKATPVARRLAEQTGLDVGAIEGSGLGGRVTSKDMEHALADAQEKTAGAPAKTPSADVPVVQPSPPRAETRPRVKASPRARELAQGAGLDLATVEGSGQDGRVMVIDVERALATARATPEIDDQPKTRAAQTLTPAPVSETVEGVVPLSGVRGVIAQRMSASAHTTAAVTTMTQADATELVRLRESLRNEWKASVGLTPSYNDLLVVILAKALGEFPYMNAHLVGEEIRQLASINIGLAVDTERGLIVPVLKAVKDMLLADVTHASRDLVQRARKGGLLPDEVSGGTFTLSNMGTFDVEASTPIINLPECAILGVGRIAARPATFEGELCLRQTVTLSLTYDHRAIDGAPAARFLERVKHLVEQPHLALVR